MTAVILWMEGGYPVLDLCHIFLLGFRRLLLYYFLFMIKVQTESTVCSGNMLLLGMMFDDFGMVFLHAFDGLGVERIPDIEMMNLNCEQEWIGKWDRGWMY